MSHSDRDQRGRPHSGKRCPESRNGGCVWCKTGDQKAHLRRVERRNGTSEITEQVAQDRAVSSQERDFDNDPLATYYDGHIYNGQRCIRCNANIYDVAIDLSSESCPGRHNGDPFVYTTTTDEQAHSNHAFFLEGGVSDSE